MARRTASSGAAKASHPDLEEKDPMPQLPRRIITLDFEEDGYPGFKCQAWVSAPSKLTESVHSMQNELQMRELMLELIPEWEFWDAEGNPVPHTIEGFDEIPTELLALMHLKYRASTTGLPPDFLRTLRNGSGSGKPTNRRARRAST